MDFGGRATTLSAVEIRSGSPPHSQQEEGAGAGGAEEEPLSWWQNEFNGWKNCRRIAGRQAWGQHKGTMRGWKISLLLLLAAMYECGVDCSMGRLEGVPHTKTPFGKNFRVPNTAITTAQAYFCEFCQVRSAFALLFGP